MESGFAAVVLEKTMPTPEECSEQIKLAARELGFDLVGVALAAAPLSLPHFHDWLDAGLAGEMSYLPRRRDAYQHPSAVMPQVRSIVMAAWNYATEPPQPGPDNTGRIARYAWGDCDYHDVMRSRLQALAQRLHELMPGCRTRVAVDTAPLLERDLAQGAGLGWFGKNTMLINKRIGSFFFLGALLTDAELAPDEPHATNHCGTCTRCLEACPTAAFPQPGVLDARRCISYLTIELKSSIPAEFRPDIGDWLFGCDICQDVCPWNRKAPTSNFAPFYPRADQNPMSALDLLTLSQQEFQQQFQHTPLSRPGWHGMRRNAALVLGNRGDLAAVPALAAALSDESPVVRGAAAWALGQLGGESARRGLQQRLELEDNADVLTELHAALHEITSANGARGH